MKSVLALERSQPNYLAKGRMGETLGSSKESAFLDFLS
jgi:hypothetical protein